MMLAAYPFLASAHAVQYPTDIVSYQAMRSLKWDARNDGEGTRLC